MPKPVLRSRFAALALLVGCALGAASVAAASDKAPARRATPPSFSLAAHDGSTVDLAKASGRPVVLVFYRGYW